MAEFAPHAFAERRLARVTEGGMPQVMPHGDGLGQILVEPQRPGDGSCNARHLDGVGHAGAVVVALRLEEDLGLVHEPPEGFRMDDPIHIPLVAGAGLLLQPLLREGAPPGAVRKGRTGIQTKMLLLFQKCSN